ncbi:OLC1v1000313C1 [Oldenlandia corymbosa var. corymbosa]|uniref:OLC1v1000313C1 n=1 Tax=Oldenlandia corymbosa var. corymbosa TaxID=529605 RepID=A0AAV1D2J4_OLDCO|nr:OLC1v1000313C1 [Oldenlandia corymbosa var. corymbosa]
MDENINKNETLQSIAENLTSVNRPFCFNHLYTGQQRVTVSSSLDISRCISRICLAESMAEGAAPFHLNLLQRGNISQRRRYFLQLWAMHHHKLLKQGKVTSTSKDSNFKNFSCGNSSSAMFHCCPSNDLYSSFRTSRFGNCRPMTKQ